MNKLPKNPLPFSLKGCYLAGGAILSIATKKEISDYDIYPKNRKSMIDVFYNLQDNGCFLVNISDRAVTWKSNEITNDNGERAIIQVMTFDNFDNPKKIFDFFDFTVCMAAFDGDTEKYHFHEDFWASVASRTLYFNTGTKYPLNSLTRVQKYFSKGYYLPKAEMVKMSLAVGRTKLPESWEELETSIGGAYGRQLRLGVDDKEYSYENAIEVLSNITFDLSYLEEVTDYGSITAEDLELIFSKKKLKCLKLPLRNSIMNDSTQEYFFRDGEFHRISRELNELIEAMGIKKKKLNPEKEITGYKILARGSDPITFTNVIHRSKTLEYKIGEYSEEKENPHIFVYPLHVLNSNCTNDRVKGYFSFKVKDIKHISPKEFCVEKVLFTSIEDEVNEKEKELSKI